MITTEDSRILIVEDVNLTNDEAIEDLRDDVEQCAANVHVSLDVQLWKTDSSMGTASYFLLGQETAMRETFGSACHGAGRVLSRSAAKKGTIAKEIQKELESRGIIVESLTREGLTEEKPEAYKDIESVVDVVHNAGLASRVARLKPIGVIKG